MADERLVIIDDDPDVREALTLMLAPAGYRLTCCATVLGGPTTTVRRLARRLPAR